LISEAEKNNAVQQKSKKNKLKFLAL